MHKKKFTRREFLKATGAAAGMAILGQACAPSGTPSGIETIPTPEEVHALVFGTDIKIPKCCSYEGDYWIENPPVRREYGVRAARFEEVIKILDDKNNYPKIDPKYDPKAEVNTTDKLIQAVKNCLGFAVDMLFQGDVHSARNALAVIAYLLIHASKIEMQLMVPVQITKDNAVQKLTIKYSNPRNYTDLWDTLSFPSSTTPDVVKPQPAAAGSASITSLKSFLDGHADQDPNYPMLSVWLGKLVVLADSLELWTVYQGDLETTDKEYQSVLDKYHGLVSACPEGCQDYIISDTMIDPLAQIGFKIDPKASYDEVVGILSIAYLGMKNNLVASLKDFNSLEADKWLAKMSKTLEGIGDVILALAKKIDEVKAKAREKVVNTSSHIWDAILEVKDCVEAGTIDELVDSLHDWWGAKKYIVIACCILAQVPTILVAVDVPWVAPFAVEAAITGFIWCFLTSMIGSPESVAEGVAACIIDKAISAIT